MDSLEVPAGLRPHLQTLSVSSPGIAVPSCMGLRLSFMVLFGDSSISTPLKGLLLFIDLSIIFLKALLGNWKYKGEAVECFQLP